MTDNIDVKPGEGATAVSVATDDVSGVHYPIYKLAVGADGAAVLVSADNPIPFGSVNINDANHTRSAHIEVLLDSVVKQMKITNLHLSVISGVDITKADIT